MTATTMMATNLFSEDSMTVNILMHKLEYYMYYVQKGEFSDFLKVRRCFFTFSLL